MIIKKLNSLSTSIVKRFKSKQKSFRSFQGVTIKNEQEIAIVRVVNRTNSIISTFAGNGQFGSFGDGGLATNASLLYPTSIIQSCLH